MSDDKILDKIKKCLALSASSNEHEAAAALRQAQKLMEAHGITDMDIQASEACESRVKAGASKTPSRWETALAKAVAKAFGCETIFAREWCAGAWQGSWKFIGCGSAPEVAHYAFAVLYRQAKRAREEHIKTRLKRCKTATKTRRADLFSEGWVVGVAATVVAFAGTASQSASIYAYMAKHYPKLRDLAPRDRNDGRNLRDHEHNDYAAGRTAGKDAQLNRGVGGAEQRAALEASS